MTGTNVECVGPNSCANSYPALITRTWSVRMTDAAFKVCATCKQPEPLSNFHKSSRMSDGLRSSCKACTKTANAASVQRHREKRLEEKRAEYRRKRDTPEFRAKLKAYTEGNKAAKAEYDREYRQRDPERERLRAAMWRAENREKRAAIMRNYRARRRAQTAGGVSSAELAAWTKAQKKVCYWCDVKCPEGFHVDHYRPLSLGGEHALHNLVIACGPCNLKKNAKDPFVFAQQLGRLL